MIDPTRRQYNAQFSEQDYADFLANMHADYPGQLEFRLAETPVFVPKAFTAKLQSACEAIIDTLTAPDFAANTEAAIPPGQRVPGPEGHTMFMAVDFAVCRDTNPDSTTYGELEPQLIELQGFPSLFCFQPYLAERFRAHFKIPSEATHLVGLPDNAAYLSLLREVILGDCAAEEVILLEIFPEKQKTRIDFALTATYLGVEAVCLTQLSKRGRELFYQKDGREIKIKRIYNRLIFDELTALPDLQTEFSLTDDVDVTWVGHPNWFFRISKFTLPLIRHAYVPESHYLSQVSHDPAVLGNLENYVLKPLFSFAGSGVKINVTQADLDTIPVEERGGYLLQRKVRYEPVIQTTKGPDDRVKCEVRLLFVWPEHEAKPRLVTNLARLSRGEMIGVRFNKDFDWVGGTIAFFES